MILAEAGGTATVTASATAATAAGRAQVYEHPYAGATLTASVDFSVGTAAEPAGATHQVVGERITIGGAVIDPKLVISWQVDEHLDRAATWSMVFPVRADWPTPFLDPLGNPGALRGPIPGDLEVTIDAVYVTATGAHAIRLLTAGVADTSSRAGGVDTVSGIDRSGRYDRALASLSLPAGHGLPRSTVIRRAWVSAGIPGAAISLPAMNRMDKAVDLKKQPAWAFGFELARVEARAPRAERDGALSLTRYHRPEVDPLRWTWGEERYLSQESGAQWQYQPPSSDVPTKLTLSASAQVTRESCARRVDGPKVSEHSEVYAPKQAAYKQDAAGNLDALFVPAPVAELQVVRRVTTWLEYECDTLIRERVVTEEMYRPIAARYILDDTADPGGPPQIGDYRSGVYLDAGAVTGDDSTAYWWSHERLTVVSDLTVEHRFGDPGTGDEEGAYKLSERRVEQGWANPEAALKTRLPASTLGWDEVDYRSDLNLLADLSGVLQANETFQVVSDTETVFTPAGGFLLGDEATTQEIKFALGSTSLYAGNRGGNAANATLQVVAVDATTYVSTSDNAHRAVTSHFDLMDPRNNSVDSEPREGHLPAAEMREDAEPPADIYDSEEEAELAAAASKYESQPLECAVDAPILEANRQPNEVTHSEVWPENHDELCAMAEVELREATIGRVSLALPANFLVRPGDISRTFSRLDNLDLVGCVDRVSNGRPGPGAAYVTTLGVKVYTI